MKKAIVFFLAVSFAIGISSCGKVKDDINKATEFDMNYASEVNVPIPSTTVVASQPLEITTPEIETGSASRFSSEGTASSLISEVKMTKFTITNANGNLDFLDSLYIYIKTPGQSDELVASKLSIPKGISSVACDLADLNIKEYIFKEKIQFRITAKVTSGSGSGDQKLKLEETLRVKGKKL